MSGKKGTKEHGAGAWLLHGAVRDGSYTLAHNTSKTFPWQSARVHVQMPVRTPTQQRGLQILHGEITHVNLSMTISSRNGGHMGRRV